jgi:hypothetical protein
LNHRFIFEWLLLPPVRPILVYSLLCVRSSSLRPTRQGDFDPSAILPLISLWIG